MKTTITTTAGRKVRNNLTNSQITEMLAFLGKSQTLVIGAGAAVATPKAK